MPKSSSMCTGCNNVTDRPQTTDRQTDDIRTAHAIRRTYRAKKPGCAPDWEWTNVWQPKRYRRQRFWSNLRTHSLKSTRKLGRPSTARFRTAQQCHNDDDDDFPYTASPSYCCIMVRCCGFNVPIKGLSCDLYHLLLAPVNGQIYVGCRRSPSVVRSVVQTKSNDHCYQQVSIVALCW